MPAQPFLNSCWRPLCSFLYPPNYKQTLRLLHFQQSERRCAGGSPPAQRNGKAMSSRIKNDLGLLQGTFIRPTGPRMPSLFSEPKRRLRLEYRWAKHKFQSIAMMFQYKFLIKSRPRPSIERRKIGPLAQVKHREIYTALAEGDMPTLRRNCTEGILSSFRTRINSRPRNEIHRWILHKYVGSPRIVSTCVGMIPMDKSAIMQVVVRLKSIQSLEKVIKGVGGKEDMIINGPGKKQLIEYMVLQKLMLEGYEQPWMVWGTTQESKAEDVLEKESLVSPPASAKS